MFDTTVFKARLAQQLDDFGMEECGAWAIAANVFVARARIIGESEWTFIFYHDLSETSFRDSRIMDRTMQLLMAGFEQGALSEDASDIIRIFHFGGGYLGECPVGSIGNAINYASQLLTNADKSEIQWFDTAQPV